MQPRTLPTATPSKDVEDAVQSIIDEINKNQYNQPNTKKGGGKMPKPTPSSKKKVARRSRTSSTEPAEVAGSTEEVAVDDKVAELAEEIQAIVEVLNEDLPIDEEPESDVDPNKSAIRCEVSSVDKFINGLLGSFEVGNKYEFTHQHKSVGSIHAVSDTLLMIHIHPSKWAQKASQAVYDACYVSDTTEDPSTVDAEKDGWSGALLV